MLALVNRAEARLELASAPQPASEIELTPALTPTETPKVELESEPKRPVEVQQAVEPPKAKPVTKAEVTTVSTEITEPKPEETVSSPKPTVVEPIPDEEREFPL
jgi:hypothetical protein